MLEVKNLVKQYAGKGGVVVKALDGVSVKFPETGMVFLLGKSGSGKSTLLNVAGGLDKPDDGEIIVKGRSSKDFSAADFDSYRNTFVGFVFQEYNILNEFTIEQNIALALQLQNKPNDKKAVADLLDQVDLSGFAKRKPNTLSGGQKQRVAIARALIKSPEIIMADEPTGALDSNTGKQVLDTLKKLSATKLVIVVSHDREFAEHYGDRIIELKDGKVISDVSKVYIKPDDAEKNVQKVGEDTITIKQAENITESDVRAIVEMLKKNGGEAVITAAKRDIKGVKRACRINDNGSKETFKETEKVKIKDYDGSETKFIKSRLPVGHAVKMGVSGMKSKPIRLIFTVLLAVVAFILFGVSSTFMLYDPDYSVMKAMQAADYPSININKYYDAVRETVRIKNATGEEETYRSEDVLRKVRFSPSDIADKNKEGLNFAGAFYFSIGEYQPRFGISLENGSGDFVNTNVRAEKRNYYCINSASGFSDCGAEYLSDNGFSIYGTYPTDKTQVALTEYLAKLFVYTENSGITDVNDIIGKKVSFVSGSLGREEFTVCGLVYGENIPIKYNVLAKIEEIADEDEENQKLKNSLKDILSYGFSTVVFVSDDFYGAYKDNMANVESEYSISYKTALNIEFSKNSLESSDMPVNGSVMYYDESTYKFYSGNLRFYNTDGTKKEFSLSEDEIYLSKTSYNYLIESNPLQDVLYYKDKNDQTGVLRIAGYYETDWNYYSNAYFISDTFIKSHAIQETDGNPYSYISYFKSDYSEPDDAKYNFIISKTSNSASQIYSAIERDGMVSYKINNTVCQNLERFLNSVQELQQIFLIIALVIGVFSALMLFNFISASISAKRKDIGVLRAVGARGSDVFKIFFAEAFIITLICFALSVIGSFILCIELNKSLAGVIGLQLLNFNVINVLLLFGVSFAVSLIATFFPVYFAAKKPPVESIRVL